MQRQVSPLQVKKTTLNVSRTAICPRSQVKTSNIIQTRNLTKRTDCSPRNGEGADEGGRKRRYKCAWIPVPKVITTKPCRWWSPRVPQTQTCAVVWEGRVSPRNTSGLQTSEAIVLSMTSGTIVLSVVTWLLHHSSGVAVTLSFPVTHTHTLCSFIARKEIFFQFVDLL